MAYGRGIDRKEHQFRAVPLALGTLTAAKREVFPKCREDMLSLAGLMAAAGFTPEPLEHMSSEKELRRILLPIQKQERGGLKSTFAEKVRINVTKDLLNQVDRYIRGLLGRLWNIDAPIPKGQRTQPDDGGPERRYYYVPPEIQDGIGPEELAALKALPEGEHGSRHALEVLRRVLIQGNTAGFTDNQVAVMREIHRQVRQRHQQPVYRTTDAIVQIPMDYRMWPSHQRGVVKEIDAGVAHLLRDPDNTVYRFFLEISHPYEHGAYIRLPLAVKTTVIDHLRRYTPGDDAALLCNSLSMELGPDGRCQVKLIIAKPKSKLASLSGHTHYIGRDFGYINTISLSVIRSEQALDEARLGELRSFTKEQAHQYLSTHSLPDADSCQVEQIRFQGRRFLAQVDKHCRKIDQLRSRIDLSYNELEGLKSEIARRLNTPADEPFLVTAEMKKDHERRLVGPARKFFQLFGLIQDLKKAHRAKYRKIAALKKNWFGFLSNIELALAKHYDAVAVRENLDIVAEEKGSPGYKGPTFNRMLNNGAQGQYRRIAEQKLTWNGISQTAIPSYYTSTTCVHHGTVDKGMRQGEVFRCPKCQRSGAGARHADDNAAYTIAAYLLLQPIHVTNAPPG